MFRVSLISDTHGLLLPEVREFLRGSDFIIHAGDICEPSILEELASLAPLTAVRGNCDRGDWAESLSETEFLQVGTRFVYAIHNLAHIDVEPNAAGIHVVVSGHTHKPLVEERKGILFVNPGSSGRRSMHPASVGELMVEGSTISARIIELRKGQAGLKERANMIEERS
ncbi:MAG: metallophosphoesterase family protein [Actinobacteria bacterium]|nr:metallophosphoesterase family protein [Actinomycetota bacterium]